MNRPPLLISVMVAVPDAPTAVAWYKRALGAVELWNLGSVVEVGDRSPLRPQAIIEP